MSAWSLPIVDDGVGAAGDVDNLVAVLELDGGAVATVDLSRNARFGDDVRTEVLGSAGALLVDALPTGRARIGDGRGMRELPGSEVDDVMAAGVAGQARAFAAAVRGGAVDVPGADGERPGDPDRPGGDRGGAHGRVESEVGAVMTSAGRRSTRTTSGCATAPTSPSSSCPGAGSITSGSVMVPCPWFAEIAEAAAADPTLDLGVHLTLTAEKEHYRWGPISGPPPSAGLTDATATCGATWRACAATPIRRRSRSELRAQVDAALAAGIDVTHLDAHMGAALAPEFCATYLALGVEYRLPVLLTRTLGGYGPSVPTSSASLRTSTRRSSTARRRRRAAALRRRGRDAVGPRPASRPARCTAPVRRRRPTG